MVRKFVGEDVEPVRSILAKSGVFSEDELEVALEVIDVYLSNPKQTDYELFSSVDDRDRVLGYLCMGPTPITFGTFDLYWIAVHPDSHGRGIGRELLAFAENLVKASGGRLIIAETSSQPRYEGARKFYESNKYEVVAHIKEYYNVGDDLLIYGKYVRSRAAC